METELNELIENLLDCQKHVNLVFGNGGDLSVPRAKLSLAKEKLREFVNDKIHDAWWDGYNTDA